jgi:prenyltransferase beta subunit
MDYYQPNTGTFGEGVGNHSWAVLGTLALSETLPISATQYLTQNQQLNGGWEWYPGWGTDTNTTALAIQALIAAGQPASSTSVVNGLDYLRNAQNDDGGFPYDPISPWGTDSDVNSTAYVVQAIVAASEDPSNWDPTGGSNPIDYLLSLQLADGSFPWQAGGSANLLATQQAIPALLGRPFPIKMQDVQQCPVVYLTIISK